MSSFTTSKLKDMGLRTPGVMVTSAAGDLDEDFRGDLRKAAGGRGESRAFSFKRDRALKERWMDN